MTVDADDLQRRLRHIGTSIDGASHDLAGILRELDPTEVRITESTTGRQTIDVADGTLFYVRHRDHRGAEQRMLFEWTRFGPHFVRDAPTGEAT